MKRNSLVRTLIILPFILIVTGWLAILAPPPASAADPQQALEEAALQKLLAFQAQLERIDARFRDRIIVPLSPFMVKVWKEMDPRLLWYIARHAAQDLTALPEEWQRAIQLGREAEQALRRAMAAE